MQLTEEQIQAIWEKARATLEHEPDIWRKDACGAWIHRDHYGARASEFGWHAVPEHPGEPSPDKLYPMHIKNAFDPFNHKPICHITAEEDPRERGGEPKNRPA